MEEKSIFWKYQIFLKEFPRCKSKRIITQLKKKKWGNQSTMYSLIIWKYFFKFTTIPSFKKGSIISLHLNVGWTCDPLLTARICWKSCYVIIKGIIGHKRDSFCLAVVLLYRFWRRPVAILWRHSTSLKRVYMEKKQGLTTASVNLPVICEPTWNWILLP